MALTVYGVLADVKTDYLEIDTLDTVKDTVINAQLEIAAVHTDTIARPFGLTLPLAGSDLTDNVKKLNNRLAAAYYLSTQRDDGTHPWIEETKKMLQTYFANLETSGEFIAVATPDYRTSPLKEGSTDALVER